MTAKQYLEQARWLDEKINANIAEVDRLRTSFLSTPDYSQPIAQNYAANDRVGEIVAKIIELEKDINDETDKFVDLRLEIRKRVKSIENPRYRLILQERYLNFRDWKAIAKIIKCTEAHTSRLHGFALVAFQKNFGDVIKCL